MKKDAMEANFVLIVYSWHMLVKMIDNPFCVLKIKTIGCLSICIIFLWFIVMKIIRHDKNIRIIKHGAGRVSEENKGQKERLGCLVGEGKKEQIILIVILLGSDI